MTPTIPPQSQPHQPGIERLMDPRAEHIRADYKGSGKLSGRRALITGGDSGIGRAAALHFAREGADVAILYLEEDEDAQETIRQIEAEGMRGLAIRGDVSHSAVCNDAVARTVAAFGGLDIVVNNAGVQYVSNDLTDITDELWQRHMDVNINGYFYIARAALPHLGRDSVIINTSSINAFAGNTSLVAYTTTKAAEMGFTRALALQLAPKGIRVNAVAPGPVWTPLQPASWGPVDPQAVAELGQKTPMERVGQPSELGPAYVYLAARDSSYVTGQTLHVNGGMIING
ncbi:glucose 1-dehydrogenase [Komagataeibacter rhaeticus]|uniref:Glucose 1-dehydrogenase n=1 Tax=Komagataeibacter rhaeticus TaxID=215221 RepID=A0A181CA30_9PROT|nr:glucose 1-dehydrogenase [Komagataeibacter rhaeticus]ATU73047.1 3-oxoacyl-ACP reductase [Komagataeibacter xylinus]QIP35208.1 glucose 1-dehydrogenase [Komagataeibacter rhaeticus]QOC47771.1 glucose 1-dehydrogenase [Komagataeibacter rhaeticus]WPP22864.1 glucose 1-dehydrogenase [Komagataeibacter rhaeticus]SAY48402.1 General stress protein 39 [Komagataeibacter rhaeticus]